MNESFCLIHSKFFIPQKYSYLQQLKIKSSRIVNKNNKIVANIKNYIYNQKNIENLYKLQIYNIYNSKSFNTPCPLPEDILVDYKFNTGRSDKDVLQIAYNKVMGISDGGILLSRMV